MGEVVRGQMEGERIERAILWRPTSKQNDYEVKVRNA